MKCPFCGEEMIEGIVKSHCSNPFSTKVSWYDKKEDDMIIKNTIKKLHSQTVAYNCSSCSRVIAVYEAS